MRITLFYHWNPSNDEDFQYYVVEKSMDMSFADIESFEVADTSFIDVEYVSNQTNYYRLVTVDHAGNHSDYSTVVEATVLSIAENTIPEVFALHQNYQIHLIQSHRLSMTYQKMDW